MKYIVAYYTISFVSLMSINMRPVMTDSNIGLHWAIHIGYLGIPELTWQPKASSLDNFPDRRKITEYGTGMFVLNRFFFSLIFYIVAIVASCVPMGRVS